MNRREALKTFGMVGGSVGLGGLLFVNSSDKRSNIKGLATMVLRSGNHPLIYDIDGNDITNTVYKVEMLPKTKILAHTYATDEAGKFFYDEEHHEVARGKVHLIQRVVGEF